MNISAVREAESVTRTIAKWGSAAAAIIFAIGFATDKMRSWEMVTAQSVEIALIVAIFAGYALAWTERFEILGSFIALVAVVAVSILYWKTTSIVPLFFFVAIGAPAAFHLIAVLLHRVSTPQPSE